ncbi:MAG: deoxyhypusine synthase family protein, partial [Planctomycetota bacterium]
KNFNLQPEPALSQILGLEHIGGYLYDIQITTAPVTDGSLSSCPPSEAVTWGKVDKYEYKRTTESMPADYSMVMPVLVKALLDKRDRLARLEEELGADTLRERHPEASGYLRSGDGYRLFERRGELMERLRGAVRERREELMRSSEYPLA